MIYQRLQALEMMVPTSLELATPTLSNLTPKITRVKLNLNKLNKPDLIRFLGQVKSIQLNKNNTKKNSADKLRTKE